METLMLMDVLHLCMVGNAILYNASFPKLQAMIETENPGIAPSGTGRYTGVQRNRTKYRTATHQ